METLTVKDWRTPKARKVRVASYTRTCTGKPFSFKLWARKSGITLATAIIIMSSYVSTYEAGKVSMFSRSDWDNISDLSFSMIDQIIPIPFTSHVEAADINMGTTVYRNGQTVTLGKICADAKKSTKPLTGDLLTYCS